MVGLILFDCDGTLVDSQHVIVETMNRAFRAEGLTPPSPESTKTIVGLSLEVAMGELVPDRDDAVHRRLAEAYKEEFTRLRLDGDFAEPLYEGALTVLDKLSAADILLGVATGKSLRGLRMVLEHHRIRDRFVTLQTADFNPSKPHPAMVETAMRETGVAPSATWLIGDTSFDMEMAVAAGVRPIGVDWGYHPTEDLHRAGAEVVLDRFEQLLDLVEHNLGTCAPT
ncbi:MAG: HAD-IA family hydrolase [Geminicoccaceae bacterium]